MSIPLRSLLFLLFGNLLLIAAPLCAEGPPPLPRANPNDGALKGLSALVSSTGNAKQQAGIAETPLPTQSMQFQTGHPETQPPKLPPKSINQASFSTAPIAQPLPETVREELPLESFYEPEYESEEEFAVIPNEMLDKPLLSKRAAKEDLAAGEDGEKPSAIGGWKNKLVKPEFTPIVSVGGSLFIVIAAFFLLAALLRKVSPKGNRPLPKEAFECLGRYFLTQKHQVQVLRMGSRIVLVSVMPDGVRTLAEITDPDEVVSFLGLCRRLDSNSASEVFRKNVASMSEEELSRPHARPAVTRRKAAPVSSLNLYSDPDESLATMLARGTR